MVAGTLQREGEVTHIVVQYCHNMSSLLQEMTLTEQSDSSMMSLSRADEKDDADHADRRIRKANPKVVQAEIFPDGRNFR
jgi:error-prone DNA polymerase